MDTCSSLLCPTISRFPASTHASCDRLVDPYVNPTLHIRQPGNDQEQILDFSGEDPFLTEVCHAEEYHCNISPNLFQMSVFVDRIVEGTGHNQILSSYIGVWQDSP